MCLVYCILVFLLGIVLMFFLLYLVRVCLFSPHPFRDSQFKKAYTCRLELTGRFAVNIIDSLIIVHHQASKVGGVKREREPVVVV